MKLSAIDWGALSWFSGRLRVHRAALVWVAALTLMQSLLAIPTLLLVRHVLDAAIPARDTRALIEVAVTIFALRVVQVVLALVSRAQVLRVSKASTQQLRDDLARHVISRGYEFFTQADLVQLHTRSVQDSERVDNALSTVVAGLVPAAVSTIVLLSVMTYLAPMLTLMAALATPLLWWAGRSTMRRARTELTGFRSAFESVSNGMQFLLRFSELIRWRGTAQQETAQQQSKHRSLRETGIRMAMAFSLHANTQRLLTGALGTALLLGGGLAVIAGRLSLGDFLSFYVAAGMLNGQLDTLNGTATELVNGSAAIGALRGLLEEGAPEPYHGQLKATPTGAFTFDRVSFQYGDRRILQEVSLQIARGQHVLITGANGAGKSTLANLLLGVLKPTHGTVLADDIPYDRLHLPSLRTHFGVVSQHAQLFRGTVRENLFYGLDAVPEERVTEVLRVSRLNSVIARLPAGLETIVGDQGTSMSGGEIQRVSIARALLASPACLILDEPTTHLDAETVRALLEDLAHAGDALTIVIISHDPAVVEFTSCTYALAHGHLRPIAAYEPASR